LKKIEIEEKGQAINVLLKGEENVGNHKRNRRRLSDSGYRYTL
jgi:hypothetical protein